VLNTGERRVRVEQSGRPAHTVVRTMASYGDLTLVEVELKTGRTHQIRVHLAHVGHPIAGDDKYGDFDLNKVLARRGLKRMFLHACRLTLIHPISGVRLTLEAPLPAELRIFLEEKGRTDAQAV
jgi:23S rRNA pseudouridine955/2504/2580 synthase